MSVVQEYCSKRAINPNTVQLKWKGVIIPLDKPIAETGLEDLAEIEMCSFTTNINSEAEGVVFLKVQYKGDAPVKFKMKKVRCL
jgi:hypothetical protein